MIFKSVSEMAEMWGISGRRIRTLAEQGRIFGAVKTGTYWRIPFFAKKPESKESENISVIKQKLAKVEHLKRTLESKRPLTSAEVSRLNNEFAIEYTYNSNAIEGNTLTLQETAWVLEGITIDKKPLKDHLEAIGHKEAFDWLLEAVKEKKLIDEVLIRQIHSLVLMDRPLDKGNFRTVDVRILGAKHTPSQPYLIKEQLNELIEESKLLSQLSPIVASAIFHIFFEQIHPFVDGNGRTGRLLINFQLLTSGYPAIDVKFNDRQRYYTAFNNFHENQNILPMIDIIADSMIARLERMIAVLY